MISTGFVAFLGMLLLRSYSLQIADNSRVLNLTERQYQSRVSIAPKRGTVYDRNGKALAMDVQVASVGVRPGAIKNPEEVVSSLASILHLPANTIREKINSAKKYEWVARRVDDEMGNAIEALKLDGVNVVAEFKRFYPNRELAGNLLGAVGYDAKSLGGLELALDSYLKSTPIAVVGEKDAKGRLFTLNDSNDVYHDVTLTIDTNIQYFTEKYLRENAVKYQVKSGFAIVMDPHTGEILAMANYPSFDPNVYWEYSQEAWKNHAIMDTYEPGSTFKSVVAATALDMGKVRPTDMFFCENGQYRLGTHVIHDHEPYGNLSVSDIIKFSSNIGATKIAQKVGKQPFYDSIAKLGFGQTPGLGLPGESKGALRPVKNWSAIDQSNIAFGQGIAVTGLQMAGTYSTFANHGVRMKPLLISKITSPTGQNIVDHSPEIQAQVFASNTSKDLTHMLEGVVEEGGTGKEASLDGYKIAGKTGTAQKVDPNTKNYAPGQFISSFIGYVPAENPNFVIYVVYDTPRPVYYGGLVAAPVFKNIAREALAYRGIMPPDQALAKAKTEEPSKEPAVKVETPLGQNPKTKAAVVNTQVYEDNDTRT